MKHLSLCFVLMSLLCGFIPVKENPNPPITLDQIFKATFPSAASVNWKKQGNYFFANFHYKGIQNRIVYDGQANMVSSIRYYDTDNLLPHIHSAVVSKYPTAAITGITEYFYKGELTFQIHLKREGQLIRVQVNAGGELLSAEVFKDQTATQKD